MILAVLPLSKMKQTLSQPWCQPCDRQTGKRELMNIRLTSNIADYEGIVFDCLRIMARFMRAGKIHLVFLSHERKFPRDFYSWAETDTEYNIQNVEPPIRLDSMWWMRKLRSSPFFRIEDIRALPDEIAEDRDQLISAGIRSIAMIPIYDGKRLIGTVRVDNPRVVEEYTGPEMDLLQIASQLIVQVLYATHELHDLKRDHARLSYTHNHDELTGLPNNKLFLDRIKVAFERDISLFAVMLVDLDYYQLVHERFGCEIGDRLVISALGKLRASLRATDIVARIGEGQFGVLLEDIQEGDYAEGVAGRIIDCMKQPFMIDQHRVSISASIGIALRNESHLAPDLILQEAVIATLQARQSGQERYRIFNASMREALICRMDMENDLRGSLEHHQLVLHYQPITEMKNGRLIGFEALVRWVHPQRGMIWPIDFIHLSEETGLILPLGIWVLREACRQMHLWNDTFAFEPQLMVSVNISPKQLEQLDFAEQVARILEETGLPPRCLRLEVTESTIVKNSKELVVSLEMLRSLGVQLYIDDFGTGYSSLGYLDTLPIDAIKIDRTFITNLGRVKSSQGVIQAIIQLAHQLNIEVVAEGVETFEQHKELKRLQCEFMQGFYISEPLDTLGVERFIAGRAGLPNPYL
jgi:diguanylate cyclase (GGDEF)-like protein